MLRGRCPISLVVLALASLVAAVPSVAEEPAWSQQKVAALAGQAADAVDALLADPEIDAKQSTAMQQREHQAAIATARQISPYLKDLKKRLDSGYTRDEAQPFWDRIQQLRGDIRAYARHTWLPDSTRQKAEKAASLLDQLASYFPETR